MRIIALTALLGGAAALSACMTTPAPGLAANSVCGTYGYVDSNNDGFISGDEWNSYRTGAYDFWDRNRDGRISQSEFADCWAAGGFYRDAYYNREWGQPYWVAFDTNRDGFLSREEYFSAEAWRRADRNNNGRIDSDEWQWWMG